MKDRMERFVLLPFTAGCISESSVAVGLQQAKRSKTEKEEEEEEDDEEDEEESLSFKTPSSLLRFHKLLKNFKNLSHSFAYKEELEEAEMGMEIGLPTDVKHVTHIGMDGCASSILSKGWKNNLSESDITNLTPFQLPHASDNPTVRSLLETK